MRREASVLRESTWTEKKGGLFKRQDGYSVGTLARDSPRCRVKRCTCMYRRKGLPKRRKERRRKKGGKEGKEQASDAQKKRETLYTL